MFDSKVTISSCTMQYVDHSLDTIRANYADNSFDGISSDAREKLDETYYSIEGMVSEYDRLHAAVFNADEAGDTDRLVELSEQAKQMCDDWHRMLGMAKRERL